MSTTNDSREALRARYVNILRGFELTYDGETGAAFSAAIAALTPPVHGDGPVAGDAASDDGDDVEDELELDQMLWERDR